MSVEEYAAIVEQPTSAAVTRTTLQQLWQPIASPLSQAEQANWDRFLQFLFEHGSGHGKPNELTNQCDDLLNELYERPLSIHLINGLWHAIKHTDDPVCREECSRFFYTWLTSMEFANLPFDEATFKAARQVILAGLTDVWSVIRKHCEHSLSAVVELCSMSQVEDLFSSLSAICSNPDSTWQQTQGAVSGLKSLIRSFKWTISRTAASTASGESVNGLYLTMGKHTLLSELPELIRQSLSKLLYRLLAHQQLSVREASIRAFAAFLSCSELAETESTMSHILNILSHETMLDASHGDGLLGLMEELVTRLSPRFLLESFHGYYSVTERYLGHPASTVRQTASKVFLAIVTRCYPSQRFEQSILFSLVAQSLVAQWSVSRIPHPQLMIEPSLSPRSQHRRLDTELCLHQAIHSLLPPRIHPFAIDELEWEWKEGRLLTYELMINSLLDEASVSSASHSHECSGHDDGVQPRTKYQIPTRMIHQYRQRRSSVVRMQSPSTQKGDTQIPVLYALDHKPTDLPRPEPRPRSKSLPDLQRSSLDDEPLLELLQDLESDKRHCLPVRDDCTTWSLAPIDSTTSTLTSEPCLSILLARLSSMKDILRQMLFQISECSMAARWELRRMADQVLSPLARLISAICPELLSEMWLRIANPHCHIVDLAAGLLAQKFALKQQSGISWSADNFAVPPLIRICTSRDLLIDQLSTLALENLVLVVQHLDGFALVASVVDAITAKLELLATQRPAEKIWSHTEQWFLFNSMSSLPALVALLNGEQANRLIPIVSGYVEVSAEASVRTNALAILDQLVQRTTSLDQLGLVVVMCCRLMQSPELDVQHLRSLMELIGNCCSRVGDLRFLPQIASSVVEIRSANRRLSNHSRFLTVQVTPAAGQIRRMTTPPPAANPIAKAGRSRRGTIISRTPSDHGSDSLMTLEIAASRSSSESSFAKLEDADDNDWDWDELSDDDGNSCGVPIDKAAASTNCSRPSPPTSSSAIGGLFDVLSRRFPDGWQRAVDLLPTGLRAIVVEYGAPASDRPDVC